MEPTERNRRAFDDRHLGSGSTRLGLPSIVRITLGDLTKKRVLHLACGSGEGAAELAELGAVVTAIDESPDLLEAARERWPSILWVEGTVEALPSALERAAWLVALAARLAIPVVVTEEEPERNGATEPLIAERLPPGTPVLRKETFGLAGSPDVLAAVRHTGRGTAVVVGCETDVCVAQSAIGLSEQGFACVVVEDAAFSPGEMHTRGLERIAAAGV